MDELQRLLGEVAILAINDGALTDRESDLLRPLDHAVRVLWAQPNLLQILEAMRRAKLRSVVQDECGKDRC